MVEELYQIPLKVHEYMEEYCRQIHKDDVPILRKYWVPVTNIYKRKRKMSLGFSVSEEKLLEESVREECTGMLEDRIMTIYRILDKAHKFIEPKVSEMETRCISLISGIKETDICVQGSNCHYTKEFLTQRISRPHKDPVGKPKEDIIISIISTIDDPLSASKVISPIDIGSLEEMKIIELVPCSFHTNKVIYATLLYDGFVMAAYHTIIEDNYGQCAKLCIYNIDSVLLNSLKIGVKIAITNPYYKLADDGFHYIRQESPEEVIVILQTGLNPLKSGDDHKNEGNQFYRAKNYEKAISCYTLAIDRDNSNPVYWSNRAQSYIKLEHFERALSDAETAAKFDTSAAKYQYRMAASWSGLGDHEKSCGILENIKTKDSEISSRLQKELILLGNTKGIFNFEELARKAEHSENIQIGEFVGPISIEISSTHGHAMIATRNIKKGELICVSKAAVFQSKGFKFMPFEKIADKRHSLLIQNLTSNVIKSNLAAFRVIPLYNKRQHHDPIPIEHYTSRGYSHIRHRDPPPYQMQQIRDIVCNYVFSYTSNFSDDFVRPKGIWPILSYFNHSCIGNVWPKCYSDILIIHSCTDIKKGEELTTSFFDTYSKLSVVERWMELHHRWHVQCYCELCYFESDPRNKVLLLKALKLCDKVSNEGVTSTPERCFQLLSEAFKLADLLNWGQTDLILQFGIQL